MDRRAVLEKVDHTLLTQTAAWSEIKKLCEEAVAYHTASVCIPPSYVAQAKAHMKAYIKENMKELNELSELNESKECADVKVAVCTVIGFPNGYQTTAVKVFETRDAIQNGADEIDMVINLGWLMDNCYGLIEEEIRAVKKACGNKILKVIIETCLLTEEEKVRMCQVVTASGADFIKTSTGFSTGGASLEDVELLSRHVGEGVKVKASGGIATFEDAIGFIGAGAERLGTSRIVKLAKADSIP